MGTGIDIVDWRSIESEFTESLILGNGASAAIDSCFTYEELLSSARSDGLISPEVDRIFRYLSSSDFELALTMLWHAHHVNRALGVLDSETDRAYMSLRSALVETVKRHHASYSTFQPHAEAAYTFMKRFKTVVPLTYDLIVYWTMLVGNAMLGTWFKDAFLNGEYVSEWDFLRGHYGGATGATMVFYPHGNLVLGTQLSGNEVKLSVPYATAFGEAVAMNDLLGEITGQWANGSVTPLFVSEGTSEQKMAAITRSRYLRSVFDNVLPKLGDSVAVYGWAASDNDEHILRQVARTCSRIAFSVHRGERLEIAVSKCHDIAGRLYKINPKASVQFYWSDSSGAWIAPAAQ